MKYSQCVGVAAAVVLVAACFMQWAFYPDLGKAFTGFYSEQNRYGRPGRILLVFSVVMIALYLVPKIWAKRANILVAAITFAFAIRSYILFTGCYRGICPEKRMGIFLMLAASAVMLVASLLPDLPIKQDQSQE